MRNLMDNQESISYEKLYRQWERTNWSATEIDFSRDAEDWRTKLEDKQRDALSWNYSLFLVGEEAVARDLTPVLDAAPGFAESIFLTTQIVDEARHHVFFDRFMREVAGLGKDTRSTLSAVDPYLTWGFRQVFDELDRVTGRLRRKPQDRELLTQSVALYHVVVEAMLAIAGQHFIQRYLRERNILPGFSEGMNNVSRDESRHVAFGVKFLGELVRNSKGCRDAAIDLWERVLPWSVGVFIPPGFDRAYTQSFGFTIEEIYAFGLRSFETKLGRVGIDPEEIALFKREDRSQTYEERARRLWVLIESGVLGDDRREPQPSSEALEIIFDGMTNLVNLEVARSLGGPVQWRFSDADPWHMVVTNGHAEAKPSGAGVAALTFETTASEWAKLAVERTSPLMSMATRRLKLHGTLGARSKASRLFRTA
ncbi:MAG: ribonucleotide-diphosphate reductase subunit beta [Actinomycetota bacterium]|nr:ribonucleotide-diphosphate reductase subunit beta [Actinomycetota bacterium]